RRRRRVRLVNGAFPDKRREYVAASGPRPAGELGSMEFNQKWPLNITAHSAVVVGRR
ncbi:hypothetical protein AB1N83_008647, partial [Pleurotus pulmonarius]